MNRWAPDLEVIDGGQARTEGPFSAADYVQLAAWAHRSVVVGIGGHHPGKIVLRGGLPWWAGDDLGEGAAAFQRLLFAGGMQDHFPVTCRELTSESRPRNMSGSAEALLLDAAKSLDDQLRQESGSITLLDAVEDDDIIDADALFVELVDAGVDALLRKDYAEAQAAFFDAHELHPEDPTVAANLERLAALGFGPKEEDA